MFCWHTCEVWLKVVPLGHPLMHFLKFASNIGVGLRHAEQFVVLIKTKGVSFGQLVTLFAVKN